MTELEACVRRKMDERGVRSLEELAERVSFEDEQMSVEELRRWFAGETRGLLHIPAHISAALSLKREERMEIVEAFGKDRDREWEELWEELGLPRETHLWDIPEGVEKARVYRAVKERFSR